MTMLQLPFYNFLRTTFRYASIHATTSPFHAAIEAWLVWIEPWNVEMRKLILSADTNHLGLCVLSYLTRFSTASHRQKERRHNSEGRDCQQGGQQSY
jgi:hypothetical protein